MTLKIQIQYCGGCGYSRQFRGLRDYLNQQPFADQIQVVGKEDRGVSGDFEVIILNTGELIHSKKTMGHGKAESAFERNSIAAKIEIALEDEV